MDRVPIRRCNDSIGGMFACTQFDFINISWDIWANFCLAFSRNIFPKWYEGWCCKLVMMLPCCLASEDWWPLRYDVWRQVVVLRYADWTPEASLTCPTVRATFVHLNSHFWPNVNSTHLSCLVSQLVPLHHPTNICPLHIFLLICTVVFFSQLDSS